MVKKSFRASMQVDNGFHKKILEIQKRIMKKMGRVESIPQITKKIIETPEFQDIENKILKNAHETDLDIKINFDNGGSK